MAARPFIEVPLNISDDRLLGGIDIERTLSTGEKHPAKGLLAEADGGALFIDHANLLEEGIANHIASALDTGEVRLEREGLSDRSPAEFVLVGTFNPREGEVSPRLRNRVGLIVENAQAVPPDSRVEIITRASRFHESPGLFCALFEEEDREIARAVASARERLPGVRISREDVRKLSLATLSLGIEGNRWDLVAVRAARASAALAGRAEVDDPDMIAAIQMVLVPRAERLPEPGSLNEADEAEPDNQSDEVQGDDGSETIDPGPGLSRQAEEMVVRAIDSRAPELNPSILKSGRPSATSGRRAPALHERRGRHVRDSESKPPSLNISVAATLRAAAPFQKRRRERAREREGVAEEASNRAAVRVEPPDLRFKQFKRRSGMLFVFAIDGSGSMALNRMAQAKGAMVRLLQGAYLHRDKVALVCFRGKAAEVLMAPTRSVEVAKRLIDALPSGGGTPLAAGLMESLRVARLSRLKRMDQSLVVVFTDGRANVGIEQAADAGRVAEELRQVGAIFRAEGVESIVIDTRSRFISGGEAQELARQLGGRYLYLPRPDSTSIYNAVTSVASSIRVGPPV